MLDTKTLLNCKYIIKIFGFVVTLMIKILLKKRRGGPVYTIRWKKVTEMVSCTTKNVLKILYKQTSSHHSVNQELTCRHYVLPNHSARQQGNKHRNLWPSGPVPGIYHKKSMERKDILCKIHSAVLFRIA